MGFEFAPVPVSDCGRSRARSTSAVEWLQILRKKLHSGCTALAASARRLMPTTLPSADSYAQPGVSHTLSLSLPTSISAESTPSPDLNSTQSKKTYLSLLPLEQIIEICLLFDPHVPVNVKTAVWPADLEAAIVELKKKASTSLPDALTSTAAARSLSQPSSPSTISQQVHLPGCNAPPRPVDDDPPMGSLRDPAEEVQHPTNAGDSSSPCTQSTTPQTHPQPVHGALPPPQGTPQHNSPPPYPYGPYGYPVPQPGQHPAYSSNSYFNHYPSHYSYPPYPHPGYPPPPPGHAPPPPPPPGGQASIPPHVSNGQPQPSTSRPPPPPPPPSKEDLPSYEEMIVEALMDFGDAEGAAPKELFTWMASRYPLQTNFRPSASQALQKAYKRGRLEKMAGGRYRLNPSWEGGTTARRPTRRPQTLAQTTYALHHPPPGPSSPFTNAPLQHHHQNPPQPYNGYPYQYPYGHYPGYPPPLRASTQPPQSKPPAPANPPTSQPSSTVSKPGEDKHEGAESGDAWEAAQHILQAINFGGVTSTTAAVSTPAAGDDFSTILAAIANTGAGATQPPRATLTDDERALLQAQLALLAAQLKEIAEDEEDERIVPVLTTPAPVDRPVRPVQPAQLVVQPTFPPTIVAPAANTVPAPASAPAPAPTPAPARTKAVEPPPPPIAAYTGTHLMLDVNAFPEVFAPSAPPASNASGTQTEVDLGEEEVDSDEDEDDMEDVVVPLPAGQAALRT